MIPTEVGKYLIGWSYLTEGSGNWETGEVHYEYNTERAPIKESAESYHKEMLEMLKPALRELQLYYLVP